MNASLQRYMAFMKTVELGSFSKAADALQYSQPAISRMIKSLEEEFGLTLLQRNSKKVALTPEGEALFPYISDVCSANIQMYKQVEELSNTKKGTLRIGVFSSISTYRMPGIIESFHRDFPSVSYELLDGDYSSIEGWIMDGRVDCGILPLPVHTDLETITLFREAFHAVLPKCHPLASRESLSARDMQDTPFILAEKGGKSSVSFFFERSGVAPDVRLISWDDYAVLNMVEKDIGISIISETILNNTNSDIVTRPLEPPLHRDIAFAVKSAKTAAPLVKQFIAHIKQHP